MNILIAEDHPMVAAVYCSIIKEYFSEQQLHYRSHTVNDCMSYVSQIDKIGPIDLAILDYNLPTQRDCIIKNGIDIAIDLRKRNSESKIIVVTAHCESLTLYEISKRGRPDALMTKNDMDSTTLQDALMQVRHGHRVLSPTVKTSLNRIWEKVDLVDDHNRQILFLLSRGYKIKELNTVIKLPASTIQKRLSGMKKAFGILEDESLVKVLADRGYI